jgi:hypothetical protein
MTARARNASMRSVIRYRILIDGRLTPRLASGLDLVGVEPRPRGTILLVDIADAEELDRLLGRLGDLGIEVVSLEQAQAT